MAVYVDNACIKFPRRGGGFMLMSHMLADTYDELHAMADRIGVSPRWFQPGSTPHYDICKSKKLLAMKYGAIEIDKRRVAAICRQWRERMSK